ncbi:hypothetical protein Bca4012_043961 [Brassica carinata]
MKNRHCDFPVTSSLGSLELHKPWASTCNSSAADRFGIDLGQQTQETPHISSGRVKSSEKAKKKIGKKGERNPLTPGDAP